MKNATKNVIQFMEDNYNLDMDSMIEQIDESQESVDLVKIGNTFYTIHNDIAGAEIENIASYLNSDIPDDIKIYKDAVEPDNSTEPVETKTDIVIGDVYKYKPSVNINNDDTMQWEGKLKQFADSDALCKVKDILITSKEDQDKLILVTFDVPENIDKGLDEDLLKEEYVVFDTDLKPINSLEEEVEKEDKKVEEALNIDNPEKVCEKLYPSTEEEMYRKAVMSEPVNSEVTEQFKVESITVDDDGSIELICKDLEDGEEFTKYIGKPGEYSAFKNIYLVGKDPLFTISLNDYNEVLDIVKPEHIEEAVTNVQDEVVIAESLETEDNNDTQTSLNLLTALNSEKEAVSIYETLLRLSTDTEEIQLLTKILEDEKEHVALLSALQASKTAGSVAEDNKPLLNEYASDTINAPASDGSDEEESKTED